MKRFFVLCALVLTGACASLPAKTTSSDIILQFHARGFTEEIPNTDGQLLEGDELQPLFQQLVNVAARHGVRVGLSEELNNYSLLGVYSEKEHMIVLNSFLTVNSATAVLIHELAHMLMVPDVPEPDDDIVAQAVAYVVMKRLGQDISEHTFFYYKQLKNVNSDYVQYTLMRYGKEINRLADRIVAEMAAQ